jgi:hypothetical protein
MTNDEDDKKMMKALALLDKDMQEHFRTVVRLIALCYTAPDLYKGAVITRCVEEDDEILMMSLNANEMDVAELVAEAAGVITQVVTEAAPPREQFN